MRLGLVGGWIVLLTMLWASSEGKHWIWWLLTLWAGLAAFCLFLVLVLLEEDEHG